MEGEGLLLLDLQKSEKKVVALLLEIEATCPLEFDNSCEVSAKAQLKQHRI